MPYKRQKDKKLALKLGIQTYQILTNDDELCIPSISSILLAVVRHLVAKNLFILSILLRKSLSLLSGSLEGTEKHKKKGHTSFSLHKDDFPPCKNCCTVQYPQ